MTKRKYHITPEQQKFRDEILGTKTKSGLPRKKRKSRWTEDSSSILHHPTRENYISNCIYWIKEYEAGRASEDRCLSAALNLKIYMEQIIKEKVTPPQSKQ